MNASDILIRTLEQLEYNMNSYAQYTYCNILYLAVNEIEDTLMNAREPHNRHLNYGTDDITVWHNIFYFHYAIYKSPEQAVREFQVAQTDPCQAHMCAILDENYIRTNRVLTNRTIINTIQGQYTRLSLAAQQLIINTLNRLNINYNLTDDEKNNPVTLRRYLYNMLMCKYNLWYVNERPLVRVSELISAIDPSIGDFSKEYINSKFNQILPAYTDYVDELITLLRSL